MAASGVFGAGGSRLQLDQLLLCFPMTVFTELELRPGLRVDRVRLAQLCDRWNIERLELFGSVLREDFHEGSDIDVLVEFQPGKTPGLRFITIQDQLTELFQRSVDLNTPQDLSRYFRDDVVTWARRLYPEV